MNFFFVQSQINSKSCLMFAMIWQGNIFSCKILSIIFERAVIYGCLFF